MANVRRLLFLCVCCLCHLIWGSVTIPTYYVNAFKVQYNYTQSQVEAILPLLSFGRILSPIPAAVYQTWGTAPTLLVGLTLSSGGFSFLWASGFFLDICYMYPVTIYTCFFVIGFGSGFLNLSIITAVTKNFTGKHQGKAVSVVLTSYALSPFITLLVYRKWFAHGQIENDARQDLHDFMLCFAMATAAVGFLFLGVSKLNAEIEPLETPLLRDMDCEKDANFSEPTNLWAKVLQEIQAVFQWPLQMIIWSFALNYSVVLGIEFNMALYAKSSGIYAIFDRVFLLFHLILCLSRVAVGFVSDAWAGTIPRTFYNAVVSIFLTVCLCAMSVFPTTELTMYMLSIILGLAAGVVKPILLTVLAQNIGKENFAKNWGIAYSFLSISLAIWAAMFPSLYSAGGQKREDCYGGYCLRWINVVTCAMATICTCCSFALVLVKRY